MKEAAGTPVSAIRKSDAARPVLHFTGRADLLASIAAIEVDYRFSYDKWHLPPVYINWVSHTVMTRTLRTGAARD